MAGGPADGPGPSSAPTGAGPLRAGGDAPTSEADEGAWEDAGAWRGVLAPAGTRAPPVTVHTKRGESQTKDGEFAGRGVLATERLAPGTLLTESEPFAFCVSAEWSSRVCHQCLTPMSTGALKRCGGGCKWAHFCSTACQRKNWPVHKEECKGLASILPHRPPTLAILLTRVLAAAHTERAEGTRFAGGVASRCDWLQAHRNGRTEEQVGQFMQLMHMAAKLSNPTGDPQSMPGWAGDMKAAMGTLFRITCNSFSICDGEMQAVGVGLYPTMAFFNHSCEPNAAATFTNATLHVRALRPIAEGDEVTISYIDEVAPRKHRRGELESTYHFPCGCGRCSGKPLPELPAFDPALHPQGSGAGGGARAVAGGGASSAAAADCEGLLSATKCASAAGPCTAPVIGHAATCTSGCRQARGGAAPSSKESPAAVSHGSAAPGAGTAGGGGPGPANTRFMHLRLDDDDGGEDNDGFLGGGGVPGVPGAASTSYGGGSGGEAGAPLLCEDEDDGPVLALLAQAKKSRKGGDAGAAVVSYRRYLDTTPHYWTHWRTIEAVDALTDLHIANEAWQQALVYAEWSRRALASVRPPWYPLLGVANARVARLMHHIGHLKQAAGVFEQAAAILRTSHGGGHPITVDLRQRLEQVHLELQNKD